MKAFLFASIQPLSIPNATLSTSTAKDRQRLYVWRVMHKNDVRPNLPESIREAVFEKFFYECVYCGRPAEVIDHIVPWSYCRSHDEYNLVASCQDCNLIASDMVFENIQEKINYIKAKREGRKWKKKLKNKNVQIFYCTECEIVIHPSVKGATNFLCASCAEKFE